MLVLDEKLKRQIIEEAHDQDDNSLVKAADIIEAIEALAEQGKALREINQCSIRTHIGHGSYSKISRILGRVRDLARAPSAAAVDLPEQALSLLRDALRISLEEAKSQFSLDYAALADQYEKQREVLTADRDAALNEADRLTQERDDALARQEALEQQVAAIRSERDQLAGRLEAAEEWLIAERKQSQELAERLGGSKSPNPRKSP